MKRYIAIIIVLVAIFAVTSASASNFDCNTGTGFVPKGIVQQYFKWDNRELQDNAGSVCFRYDYVDVYDVVVEWELDGDFYAAIHKVLVPISALISSEVRSNQQTDGFTLSGYCGSVCSVPAPVIGDHFGDSVITAVSLISSSGKLVIY